MKLTDAKVEKLLKTGKELIRKDESRRVIVSLSASTNRINVSDIAVINDCLYQNSNISLTDLFADDWTWIDV